MSTEWYENDTFHRVTWPMVDATDFATRESGINASDIDVEVYGGLRGSSAAFSLIISGTGSLTKDIAHVDHGTFELVLPSSDISGTGAAFYDQYLFFASCAGCALQELLITGHRIDPSDIYSAAIATQSLVSDIDSALTLVASELSDIDSQLLLNASVLSDVDSQLTVTHSLISDIESQVDLLATSDYLSNLHSVLTSTLSDALSAAQQTNSRVLVIQSLVSDIDSQVLLNASAISDIDSQLTVTQSLLSDVDSQVNLTATSDYLSAVHSDLASAIGDITVNLDESDISDIASAVTAAIGSTISDIYSLVQDVDSQLLLTASLVSDVDSQLQLVATSDYLSAVHSDLKSAVGNVSVTLGSSDISDIASAVTASIGSTVSDIYSLCQDIDSQVLLNASLLSDVDSQLLVSQSLLSDVDSQVALTDATATAAKENTDYPDGYVFYDPVSGSTGTTEGTNGTPRNPVSSYANAITIANARGIKRIKHVTSAWPAVSPIISSVTLSSYAIDLNNTTFARGASVTTGNCSFSNGDLNPLFGGDARWHAATGDRIRNCRIIGWLDVDGVPHSVDNCKLAAVKFATAIGTVAQWLNCGAYYGHLCIFDFNDLLVKLGLPGWYGDLEFKNMTAACEVDVYGWGELKIYDTCTAGTIRVTSHVEVVDENGDPWENGVGKPTVTLISEPGGVSSFSGSALSDINAIKSLISDVDSQLLLSASGISDIESQLDVTHSLLSDIESQVDAGVGLNASALSDVHSATLGRSLTEPTSEPAFSDTMEDFFAWWAHLSIAEIQQTATKRSVRNIADDSTIASMVVSDDGTTFTDGAAG